MGETWDWEVFAPKLVGKWEKSYNFKITIILITILRIKCWTITFLAALWQGIGVEVESNKMFSFSTKHIITCIIGKGLILHSLFRVTAILIHASSVTVF